MNQKQHEIILILEKLRTHFNAKPVTDEKLIDYAERLQEFTTKSITQAVEKVIDSWDWPSFPTIATIKKHCRTSDDSGAPRTNITGNSDTQKRIEAARRNASEYTANYIKLSATGQQATLEGWWHALQKYVYAFALFQADVIEKVPNIGYDGSLMFGADYMDEKLIWRTLKAAREQAERGSIEVTVSTTKIEEFKARHRLELECAQRPQIIQQERFLGYTHVAKALEGATLDTRLTARDPQPFHRLPKTETLAEEEVPW